MPLGTETRRKTGHELDEDRLAVIEKFVQFVKSVARLSVVNSFPGVPPDTVWLLFNGGLDDVRHSSEQKTVVFAGGARRKDHAEQIPVGIRPGNCTGGAYVTEGLFRTQISKEIPYPRALEGPT